MQKIWKAQIALAKAGNHVPLADLVSPNILFDSQKKKQFLVLGWREEEFASREQLHHALHVKGAVHNENDVDSMVWNKPNLLNAAIWFLTYLCLAHVALLTHNNTLYKMLKGWTACTQ